MWSAAWAAQSAAVALGSEFLAGGHAIWLVFYAFLEFLFAVLLVAAARAGFSGYIRNWRTPLMIAAVFPAFLAGIYTFGTGRRPEAFHALHACILGTLYVYNYAAIRGKGLGGTVFRLSLLCLGGTYYYHAAVFVYAYASDLPAQAIQGLGFAALLDFALNALASFAAMAMWIEHQRDRMRELAGEVDRVRRDSARSLDLDGLTGLLNGSALSKRMDDGTTFAGVAAVCDMDEFKEINDRYGHLAGDEILRNIGHLLRASIRPQDEAFRWGGDEFVVLFHNEDREVACARMQAIANRLRDFRVRGHGVLPISFSWGAAEAASRSLRDVVDEADRQMYACKRTRR